MGARCLEGAARVAGVRRRAARRRAPPCVRAEAGERAAPVPTEGRRRVVVTGMGVVSSVGCEPDEFYDNLLAGRSGIATIEGFDASGLPTTFAGEVKDFSAAGYIAPKMARRVDRFISLGMVAAKKALEDAGLPEGSDALEALDKLRCGVLVGSAMGGMDAFSGGVTALNKSGVRKMNPFCIPFSITNMAGAMAAMDVGFMGPNYSISSACATGNYAIQQAAGHIARGEADIMVAGATDSAVLDIGMAGFSAARALSTRNDDPAAASRPWDVDRDGFVMGEGAGCLMLEELEHAKARGARIHAEFLGGAYTCDAYHMTDPHPEGVGVKLCIEKALVDAGVSAEHVQYVNAHATSTPAGDIAEYKAIAAALAGSPSLKINSTKSMIGHLLGAAGAVEAVACIKAIQTGWLHPTINVDNPDPAINLDHVVLGEKLHHPTDVVLSNSFGFGGHCSSILFGAYRE